MDTVVLKIMAATKKLEEEELSNQKNKKIIGRYEVPRHSR